MKKISIATETRNFFFRVWLGIVYINTGKHPKLTQKNTRQPEWWKGNRETQNTYKDAN